MTVLFDHYRQWYAVLHKNFNDVAHSQYTVTDAEVKWSIYCDKLHVMTYDSKLDYRM
jgi:hypothetical protein